MTEDTFSLRWTTDAEQKATTERAQRFLAEVAASLEGLPNMETDPVKKDAAKIGARIFTAVQSLLVAEYNDAPSEFAREEIFNRVGFAIGLAIGSTPSSQRARELLQMLQCGVGLGISNAADVPATVMN